MKKTGKFIVSLDFELLWGMRDHETIESYGKNILGVRKALPMILDVFEIYGVKATFATVGLLFSSNKQELESFFPKVKPQYDDKNLSPYNGYLKNVRNTEDQDKYHFASNLIDLIGKYSGHEIATHTFSHFYCLESGQTREDFKVDLKAAIKIAKRKNIEIRSIVFPRNQYNKDYIKICHDLGIISYRGCESAWFYQAESRETEKLNKRFFRLLDSYINISGHNSYAMSDIVRQKPYNIPSSSFLRPYQQRFWFAERFRINRILNSMTYAAKNAEVFSFMVASP